MLCNAFPNLLQNLDEQRRHLNKDVPQACILNRGPGFFGLVEHEKEAATDHHDRCDGQGYGDQDLSDRIQGMREDLQGGSRHQLRACSRYALRCAGVCGDACHRQWDHHSGFHESVSEFLQLAFLRLLPPGAIHEVAKLDRLNLCHLNHSSSDVVVHIDLRRQTFTHIGKSLQAASVRRDDV